MRVRGRRVLVEGRFEEDRTVTLDGGRIVAIDGSTGGADRAAGVVAPGRVDLRYNGGFGVEIGTRTDCILHVSARLPATGTTSFLPTLVTSPPDVYPQAYAAFADARARRAAGGAIPLGLHLEGPFLSPDAAGAHHREWLERADPRLRSEER